MLLINMNIKHNRYILFIGPLIWTLVAMSTPKTIEAGIFTIWFVLTTAYDFCEISHWKIYIYSPKQVSNWRQYVCTETVMTCWFAAMGFPRLSVFGILFIKLFKNPIRLSAVMGFVWLIWYTLGLFIDWAWVVGSSPSWYGVLIFWWGVTRYGITTEIGQLGKPNSHATKQYTIIWLFRFVEQFLLSTLRWFTWCECVFPYQQRFDIWAYGVFITIAGMALVNQRRPQKMLKFTQSFEAFHMPAPCKDTADQCNICRDKQYLVDVEAGNWLWENESHKIL